MPRLQTLAVRPVEPTSPVQSAGVPSSSIVKSARPRGGIEPASFARNVFAGATAELFGMRPRSSTFVPENACWFHVGRATDHLFFASAITKKPVVPPGSSVSTPASASGSAAAQFAPPPSCGTTIVASNVPPESATLAIARPAVELARAVASTWPFVPSNQRTWHSSRAARSTAPSPFTSSAATPASERPCACVGRAQSTSTMSLPVSSVGMSHRLRSHLPFGRAGLVPPSQSGS